MANEKKILKAASELLLEKGPAGLSVRAIAGRAGVSTMGIYSHFNGKQGVLDVLYMEGYQHVYDAMPSPEDFEDPKQALMEGARNYIRVSQVYEANYRLIFGETDFDYQPGDAAREASQRAFERLVDLVLFIFPPGASRVLAQEISLRFWALLHGYISIQHHVVLSVVLNRDWEYQALAAVENMIDSLLLANPQHDNLPSISNSPSIRKSAWG